METGLCQIVVGAGIQAPPSVFLTVLVGHHHHRQRLQALVAAYQPVPLAVVQQLDPIYVDVTQSSAELLRLRVTNSVSGPTGGEARNIRFTPTLPPGYTLSGPNIVSNLVVLGNLAPGASSNVTLTLQAGGTCPLPLAVQSLNDPLDV